MNNKEAPKPESHFIPGFLFGALFGCIVTVVICWLWPISVRDEVIADLSKTFIEQAKTIDTYTKDSK